MYLKMFTKPVLWRWNVFNAKNPRYSYLSKKRSLRKFETTSYLQRAAVQEYWQSLIHILDILELEIDNLCVPVDVCD